MIVLVGKTLLKEPYSLFILDHFFIISGSFLLQWFSSIFYVEPLLFNKKNFRNDKSSDTEILLLLTQIFISLFINQFKNFFFPGLENQEFFNKYHLLIWYFPTILIVLSSPFIKLNQVKEDVKILKDEIKKLKENYMLGN
jgi:hypothetical protein